MLSPKKLHPLSWSIRTIFLGLSITTITFTTTSLYANETASDSTQNTAKQETTSAVQQLPLIIVHAESDDATEASGYLAKELKQVGPWGAKSLQDTPYSMSVMSSDLIENSIAGNMDQIYKMNPVIQNSAPSTVYGTPYAAIRGFHTQSGIMDGLRLSSTSTGIAMEELDRVEIINGLTGFMYGVGNVGGTTNYVLKRPTYERLTNVTIGNYGNDQWFGHIDLGDKIDDEGVFAYRFNAAYQNGETGKENQNIERALISGALDWNITDKLLLQLEAAHSEYKLDGIDSRFYAYADQNFGALDYWIKPLKNDKTYTPDWTYLDISTDRFGLNAKYDINDIFSIRSAYMYKKDTQESINLYPAYYDGLGYANGWVSKSAPTENIAQAFYTYLDSNFSTGSIKHKLTLGISSDFLDIKQHANGTISAGTSPIFADANDLMSWAMPTILNNNPWGSKYTSSKTSNTNVIIGDDIQINEKWNALIGLNYTTIKTRNLNTQGTTTTRYDKSEITPTISIIYKPIENLTTYVSYMEGLEKGSTVPDTKDQNQEYLYNEPGKILDPSISTQYEIGAKYAFSDRLMLSSALFRIEKANTYEERVANGKLSRNQDGEEIHQGLELTLTGKITDNLTIMTGGTWMNLSIEKATNKALEGKEPSGVSGILAKVYTEYKVPYLDGFSLTGGAYYSGSMYKDSLNQQEIDAYTIFDLGARYKTDISNIPTTFNLNIANLTNKDYWATTYSLGIPRTVAFSIKSEF